MGAWATGIVASICSIAATVYYYNAHEILLYEDARSHMRIARSAFDSLTPGIAQLGSVWLPLPHILMWPFLWNDFLWHSGLAGSLVAMPCYVLSCLLIYLISRHFTHSSVVSFLGMLVFALNANILYLQSTPLSELVCISTSLLAIYCLIHWAKNGLLVSLCLLAFATFLATLARYDGWPLAITILALIPIISILKGKGWKYILSTSIIYSFLAFLGIVLWLIWNKMIFGDFLYFARGPYSSIHQQLQMLQVHRLFSYHSIGSAIWTYTVDIYQSLGLPLSLAIGGCILISLIGKWTWVEKLTLTTLFVPFIFYTYSLYGGQAIIWIPGANPTGIPIYMYNVRYGAQMIAPAAIFLALGLSFITRRVCSWQRVGIQFVSLCLLCFQSFALLIPGGIVLQDGQYNVTCLSTRVIDDYIYQHYDGGLILNDVSSLNFDTTFAGIDFKNVVYEGSGKYWQEALTHPEQYVQWVVINPNKKSSDLVAQYIRIDNPVFAKNFTLVARQSNGALLFHHNGFPLLPNRAPIPQYVYPHHACI